MKIVEVNSNKTASDFLLVPVKLYAQEANWIRPWDKDINSIFDIKTNKLLRNGSCCRWVLYDEHNNNIGRIAAFINEKSAKKNKVGGMGFFECINNQNAANLLFETAKNWLLNQEMPVMEGPINFGDRDKWWGLLVDGFAPPTYGMNYNFPYYQTLFEQYGFKKYYAQYVYNYTVQAPVPTKFGDRAQNLMQDANYRFVHVTKNDLDKFAEYFHEIYNAAWAKHHGFKPMNLAQCKNLMQTIKPIMDEKLIWFGFYNDTPIAFFIMLPELNMAIKYLNGKSTLFHKLKLLYYLKFTKKVSKAYGVIFGVIPQYQALGIEGGLIKAAEKVVQPLHKYTDIELTWIGSFNPKMIAICEKLQAKKIKTLHTYRYLFDRQATFEEHPFI